MEESCPKDYTHFDMRNFTDDEITIIMDTQSIIFKVYLQPGLSFFGMIANMSFLFVLIRIPSMRTITNCYLGNLALADFLYLFVMTLHQTLNRIYLGYLVGSWYFEAYQCIFMTLFFQWPYFASLGLITLVSMERFIGICYPLKSRMMSTMSRTVKLIAAMWVLSFLPVCLNIPGSTNITKYCLTWHDKYAHHPRLIRFCGSSPGSDVRFFRFLIIISEVVPFMIVLFANSFFFFKIIRTLGKRSGNITAQTSDSNQMREVQKQVAKMLVINGSVFLISYIPWITLQSIDFVELVFDISIPWWYRNQEPWSQTAQMMLFINSSANPLIYGATNPRYRQAFRQAFGLSIKKSESKVTEISAVSQSQRNTAL